MEDGAPVHKDYAKIIRALADIIIFESLCRLCKWPPSSPDLNPIEKVWRWMKVRISQLDPLPTTIEGLKLCVQILWDNLDSCG
jgi:hypothetical protein